MKTFHLNGHTIGFSPQTQKLELHYYMCPELTVIDTGSDRVKLMFIIVVNEYSSMIGFNYHPFGSRNIFLLSFGV